MEFELKFGEKREKTTDAGTETQYRYQFKSDSETNTVKMVLTSEKNLNLKPGMVFSTQFKDEQQSVIE